MTTKETQHKITLPTPEGTHLKVDYLKILPSAANRILESIQQQLEKLNNTQGKEQLMGLKISLKAGSCGAFSYSVEFAYKGINLQPEDDLISLPNGCNVFIDPNGSFILFGTEMDYQDNGIEYGFKFNNPNEGGKCKCGTSFYASPSN